MLRAVVLLLVILAAGLGAPGLAGASTQVAPANGLVVDETETVTFQWTRDPDEVGSLLAFTQTSDPSAAVWLWTEGRRDCDPGRVVIDGRGIDGQEGPGPIVALSVSVSMSYSMPRAGLACPGTVQLRPGVWYWRMCDKTNTDAGAMKCGYDEEIRQITIRAVPACRNRRDDDGDGRVDYPADPGCSSSEDAAEPDSPACSDGRDNDSDGRIDTADGGCSGATDTDERPQCSDTADNDGDGERDGDDRGCSGATDNDERLTTTPTLSMRDAVRRTRRALVREFGSRFSDARYERECDRLSRLRIRCEVEWSTRRYAFSGWVTIRQYRAGEDVKWNRTFRIKRVDRRCRAAGGGRSCIRILRS